MNRPTANAVRSVTPAEVEHFKEHGWVKLDQLVSQEFIAQLRERSKPWIEGAANDAKHGWWIDYYDPVERDACFKSLGLSAAMGMNAQRLMRRSVGVLLYSNLVAVKVGAGHTAKSKPSLWHQDGTDTPIDRSSWVRFWIALDRVTPDMGSINFIDRSHRLGLLGDSHLREPDPNRTLLEQYPDLKEYGSVGPLAFEPGDATVHTMYTVHGAPSNETDRPRWAFIATYFADDTRYTGSTDRGYGFEKAQKAGLARGDLFGGPIYPQVCDSIPI